MQATDSPSDMHAMMLTKYLGLIPVVLFIIASLGGCALPGTWKNHTFEGLFKTDRQGEQFETDFLRLDSWDSGRLDDGTYWWMFELCETSRDDQRHDPPGRYVLRSRLAVIVLSPTDEPITFDSTQPKSPGVSVWHKGSDDYGASMLRDAERMDDLVSGLPTREWSRATGSAYLEQSGSDWHVVMNLQGETESLEGSALFSIDGEVRTNTYIGSVSRTKNMKGHVFYHYKPWRRSVWPDE